ncbi:cupin domain-containing protein [Spirochaetia bacterium 38H-sp]|uniref:Cupin domain-containing protein n=1 Tax=Rarispira pelagica TaxID=3141764 RepID=A0ABU9UEL7_9SPIR
MEIKKLVLKDSEIEERGIRSWPVWSCGVERFPWKYDSEEHCLILEGHVVVETDDGSVELKAGDYVIFPEGLVCTWDVKKPVKKHYSFF